MDRPKTLKFTSFQSSSKVSHYTVAGVTHCVQAIPETVHDMAQFSSHYLCPPLHLQQHTGINLIRALQLDHACRERDQPNYMHVHVRVHCTCMLTCKLTLEYPVPSCFCFPECIQCMCTFDIMRTNREDI